MMLPLTTTAYRYRPLKQGLKGWDVWALQTALQGDGRYSGALDGDFGPITDRAVRALQTAAAITVDGIAGVQTQRVLATRLLKAAAAATGGPYALLLGVVEYESAFLFGNHSPAYGEAPWFDVGIAQMATRYYPIEDGFHAVRALHELGTRVATKRIEYSRLNVVRDPARILALAGGSWNAPAWTDRLARGGALSQSQSEWIENYIKRVTVYL